MKLQIATPEKIVYSGEADDLLLFAYRGQLNILNHHADLVSFLEPGPLLVRKKGEKEKRFEITRGLIKVENNEVVILCPSVEEKAA